MRRRTLSSRGRRALGVVECDSFAQGHADRRRGRPVLWIAKIDKPHGRVPGVQANPLRKILVAGHRGRGPEGSDTPLMGGKQQILDRAGCGADFIQSRNLAAAFCQRRNSDTNRSLEHTVTQFSPLLRTNPVYRRQPVIEGLKLVGQTKAGVSGEYVESPWLVEPMGGRPMRVLENFDKQLVTDAATAVHLGRFDRSTGPVWKG